MDTDQRLVEALRALCEREGGGALGRAAVAATAGLNDQSLYQILAGVKNKSGRPKGVGPVIRERLDTHYPGWTELQRSLEGQNPFEVQEAQFLSHHFVSDHLPLIAWEAIVKSPVPEVFRTVLPDDALGPDLPKGTEILWSTKRRAMPGRVVSVKDAHDQVHARECRQGREPGRWLATPTNSHYLAFDSTEVTLLAVFKARLEPDDA
jgi:hypothetical protein